MTPNSPVEILKQEHQIILRVLSAFEARLQQLDHGPFPKEFFQQALDFFANFADGCHHYKEEDSLFPLMVSSGVAGPISCMLQEHEFGRNCLRTIRGVLDSAARGDQEAVGRIREAGSAYVQMLRSHIYKEDNILFMMAGRVLSAEDLASLQADFTNESNPKINSGVREKYEALAAKLTAVAAAR